MLALTARIQGEEMDRDTGLMSIEIPPRFAALIQQAQTFGPLPVVVVDAHEQHVLAGVLEACDEGLIAPTLLGPQQVITALCEQMNCPADRFPIVDVPADQVAAELAVQLVLDNKAAALIKGWIHTDILMHPVLAHLRGARRVSHVFVADLPSYHKLLFVTDAAINIMPDLATKAAILQNAIDLARLLNVPHPKAAALSAVEVVKPSIPSTLDAACLSKMAQRGQITHAVVDGPLAFDNAISSEAARVKQIVSEVPGDVDILLAPDLDAGNILAKDLEYLASATLAGIVVGARVPVILTSRSDPSAARLVSAAIAVLMHQHWGANDS